MIEVTAATLAAHPFLRGMPASALDELASFASVVAFPPGRRIFEDGGYADKFWLVQSGHVALDMYVPGEGPVFIDTVGMGEPLGWSSLFPPYRWAFGAVCVSGLETFEFEAAAARERCAADAALGYEFTRRLVPILAKRLQGTRARLITRSPGRVDLC